MRAYGRLAAIVLLLLSHGAHWAMFLPPGERRPGRPETRRTGQSDLRTSFHKKERHVETEAASSPWNQPRILRLRGRTCIPVRHRFRKSCLTERIDQTALVAAPPECGAEQTPTHPIGLGEVTPASPRSPSLCDT